MNGNERRQNMQVRETANNSGRRPETNQHQKEEQQQRPINHHEDEPDFLFLVKLVKE